jgi:hypothetical protein
MLRAWVGMTGPVIHGRAGRTPLPESMAASIIQPPEAFNLLKRRPETG